MNPFVFAYTELLFRPLLNLLVVITNLLPNHSVGLAIIVVTLLVRLVLLPSSWQQAKQASRNQAKMKEVQGELDTIKRKHKDDRAKQAEETMAVYRKAGINPAAGCLPLLIQLPILIALYRVFLLGLNDDSFQYLYPAVSAPEALTTTFLSIPLDAPSLLLGVIAGVGQFFLMRATLQATSQMPGTDEQSAKMMASMQRNMMYIFPVMTIFIALQLPAALSLYWVASTFFAMGQQYLIKRALKTDAAVPVM